MNCIYKMNVLSGVHERKNGRGEGDESPGRQTAKLNTLPRRSASVMMEEKEEEEVKEEEEEEVEEGEEQGEE